MPPYNTHSRPMLMNSLWNLLDWLLPSIRLPDDLADHRDPEALLSHHHYHHRPSNSYSSSIRSASPSHPYSNPTVPSSYPPRRSVTPHQIAQQQQGAVASNRAVSPEWQKERDKRDKDREHRDRDKERVERERLAQEHRGERDNLLKRIKSLESDKAALQRETDLLRERVERLSRDLQISREDEAAIKKISSRDYVPPPHSFSPPPSDPAALRDAYDSLLSSHAHTHDALCERTEELASLNSFLSKTDDWSGAQLIQALRDLNTEIVQLAASLADEFSSPSSSFAPHRVESSGHVGTQKAKDLVVGMIGMGMTHLLLGRDHTEDAATVVQFAIQAWEVVCVGRALDSFYYGLPREIDQFLTRMFDHMHRSEPQPTTSRWRALTYSHTRTLLSAHNNTHGSPFQTLTDHNARGLLSILALCNFPSLPREALLSRYGAHLTRISERAERLAGAVREGVMSAGFEVVWVRPVLPSSEPGNTKGGKKFDEGWMEDVYAELGPESEQNEGAGAGGSEKGGSVMCTVEFGLVLVRKSLASGKKHSGDGSGMVNGTGHSNGYGTSANGRATMTNGHAHAPMANGHGQAKPHANGVVNGVAGTASEGEKPLSRTLLVKPRVLLDSVSQLV